MQGRIGSAVTSVMSSTNPAPYAATAPAEMIGRACELVGAYLCLFVNLRRLFGETGQSGVDCSDSMFKGVEVGNGDVGSDMRPESQYNSRVRGVREQVFVLMCISCAPKYRG